MKAQLSRGDGDMMAGRSVQTGVSVSAMREHEACGKVADELLTIEMICIPTDEADEWDLVPSFQHWMDCSLIDVLNRTFWTKRGEWFFGNRRIQDKDYAHPLWQETTRWDCMKNDLSLWYGCPDDYLHVDENILRHLHVFSPDYMDWSRLRTLNRDEWHRVVMECYEREHQIETGPYGSGFRRHYAVLDGWLDRNGTRLIDRQNRLFQEWLPGPNNLRERRLRIYPEITAD
jgi:hypothetical protein